LSTKRTGFAELLKDLRRAKGLSQGGLAAASGVPVATIRQWEYGRREPSLGALLRVAKGLGISLAVFDNLAGAGQSGAEPPSDELANDNVDQSR